MILDYILLAILVFGCVLLVKNCVAFNRHNTITDAIHKYHVDVINNHNYSLGYPVFQVEYKDMEPYEKTVFRLLDWSYERILPQDKYEIIKPYIKKKH